MDGVRLEKRKSRLGESELPCAESDLAKVGCQRTGWTCRFSGPTGPEPLGVHNCTFQIPQEVPEHERSRCRLEQQQQICPNIKRGSADRKLCVDRKLTIRLIPCGN